MTTGMSGAGRTDSDCAEVAVKNRAGGLTTCPQRRPRSTLAPERLVLRNDLAELGRLAWWIEGWMQHDVSADMSFALQLCLEEAVANIVMYGGAKEDRLEIAVEHNGGTLVARIEDTGRQFDPPKCRPH
jgi:anti-sigma regulatory factor (Ser/Thr protein kinase)